ncbi:hypothetical protein ABK040_014030 [Willaertia magna]
MSKLFLYAASTQPSGLPFQYENSNPVPRETVFVFTPLECLNFKYTKIYTHSSTIVLFRTPTNDLLNLSKNIVKLVRKFCKEEFKKMNKNCNLDLQQKYKKLEFKNVITNEKYYLNESYFINLDETFVKIGWLTNSNALIYCNNKFLILLDENKLHLIKIDLTTRKILKIYFKGKKIKQIISGPISNDFLVILENYEIYKNATIKCITLSPFNPMQQQLSFDIHNVPIFCGSSGGCGFCLVPPYQYNNNNIAYSMGVNTLGGFGVNYHSNSSNFVKIDSPLLENEKSPIISVKAGYWHHIFLLENGKVIGVGYNGLKQANCDLNGSFTVLQNNSCDFSYCLLDQYIPNLGKIKKIGCSSRGSYFWNEEDEIYFVGEVVEKFKEKRMIINGNVNNVYKMELKSLREQYNIISNEYFPNEVVCGGWHYFIAFDKDVNDNDSKDLKYFFMKLQEMCKIDISDELSDVQFNF